MKKYLLMSIAFGIATSAIAQETASARSLEKSNPVFIEKGSSSASRIQLLEKKKSYLNSIATVTVIPIGSSGNCFGQGLGPRTNVWADPRINSVVVTHRLSSATGHTWDMFGVDISTNGGATFTSNVKCYDPAGTPPGSNGRFPQVGIYNPPGNTVAANAFAAYYGVSLSNTNGPPAGSNEPGGACSGAVKLDGTGANQVQYVDKVAYLHENLKIKQTGDAIVMSRDHPYTLYGFSDTVTVARGVWNGNTKMYDYTRSRIVFPLGKDGKESIYNTGDVAFANDGLTGFYVNIGHPGFSVLNDSVLVPIIWKTSDGGTTWKYIGAIDINSAAIVSALGLTPGTRMATGFEVDLTVDSKKDLHIVTVFTPKGTPFSVTVPAGHWGVFDIRTTDAGVGSTWSACLLGKPQTYRGSFQTATDLLENDSRGQTSRTWAGDKVFFTYFDTDTLAYPGLGNIQPDAIVCGYDVVSGKWMAAKNVTGNTDADAACNFGMVGEYVFGNSGTYKIPLVYSAVGNVSSVSQMFYVDGIQVSDAEFSTNGNCSPVNLMVVGVNEIAANAFSVSDNYPNPFRNTTNVKVNISKPLGIYLDVYNALGQKMMNQKTSGTTSGTHTFTIDGTKLNPGIYFYTVRAGEKSVTKKMIVN